MANRHNKKRNARTPLKEFVTVAFAEDMDLAKHYKKLLSEDDIPAIIRTQSEFVLKLSRYRCHGARGPPRRSTHPD